jgi:hypothetical protein
MLQVAQAAIKDIEINIAIDALQPAPVAVLPELPFMAGFKFRLTPGMVAGNPDWIVLEMSG